MVAVTRVSYEIYNSRSKKGPDLGQYLYRSSPYYLTINICVLVTLRLVRTF
jgi:hypothetical protein